MLIRDHSYDKIVKDKENDKENDENFKNENNVPFIINPAEEIENIQKIESHKLDYNYKLSNEINFNINNENKLLYDSIKEGQNHWGIISQPTAPPIDRDAGTKIKYVQPIPAIIRKNSIIPKNLNLTEIKEHSHKEGKEIKENKENKENINNLKKQNKKKIKKSINNEEDKNPRKKKYIQMIEFPSEDLDPKLVRRETDNEELKKLRKDLENEIAEKKIEMAKKLKQEQENLILQKALEEKRKELANKNVTTDIKGDLVFIKYIDINNLKYDFTKGNSKFREIKKIEDKLKEKYQNKNTNILVEKNPDIFSDPQEQEKSFKKKPRIRMNQFSPIKKKSTADEKNNNKTHELHPYHAKNRKPLIAAGSNFDIMNLECGVNLTEDKKTKSGGKDYLKKYNKYSLHVFEEILNKTATSNFYKNSAINVMSLKKKNSLKDNLMDSIKESESKNLNNIDNLSKILPNEANNKLFVKTKDLRKALNELDLIAESEEKILLNKKNNRNKNKNIMKRRQFITDFSKKAKRDFDEVNKFAKTIVSGESWRIDTSKKNKIKQSVRMPTKPVFEELKRELPASILNHLPRKRLPPINISNRFDENSLGYTMTEGFYNNKNRKIKLKGLSKEENKNIQIDGEKNDNNNKTDSETNINYNTSLSFYKNTMS